MRRSMQDTETKHDGGLNPWHIHPVHCYKNRVYSQNQTLFKKWWPDLKLANRANSAYFVYSCSLLNRRLVHHFFLSFVDHIWLFYDLLFHWTWSNHYITEMLNIHLYWLLRSLWISLMMIFFYKFNGHLTLYCDSCLEVIDLAACFSVTPFFSW